MPEPDEPRVPPKRARWFIYTDASSLGIEIAVAITFGAMAGYYIERYLTHWSPWTMLLGFAFGVVVAVKAVLRTARAYQASLRATMPPATSEPPATTGMPPKGGPRDDASASGDERAKAKTSAKK